MNGLPPHRIWIDLSNSPHPLLFAPVSRALEERGHTVLVTVRDHAQTMELALSRWPGAEVIGGESPVGRAGKARALAGRVSELYAWSRRERPDVALSHNSYAQIVAARATGVRVVTAMDFEHQPSNHLAFRLAHLVLLPEAIPAAAVRRQGARASKVRRYAGLKESLYVGDFKPNRRVAETLGIAVPEHGALVVARTPPSGAIYHRFENHRFGDVLMAVCRQDHVRCVLLVRHPDQRRAVEALALPNCTIPEQAVDARALIHEADLVIGAGGTMSREAALIGVPTLSLFAGTQPAVDRRLIERGEMERFEDLAQVTPVKRRAEPPHPVEELRRSGEAVLEAFLEATLAG